MPYAVSRGLRRVAFRPFSSSTNAHMPTFTHPWRAVTGDEIVTWNTAANYVHEPRYEQALYERVCDCAIAPGQTCNCTR